MISCFIGLFKMWRFIDKNYDAAKETYAKRVYRAYEHEFLEKISGAVSLKKRGR